MKRNLCAHQTPRKFRLPMLGNRTATTSGPRPAPTTMASAVPAAGAMNGCFVFEDGDSTSNNSDSTSKNWALDQQKWIEMGEFKRQKPQIQPAKHRIRGVKHGDNGNWTSYQCGFDQQKWSPKIRGSGHSTRTWSKLHPQVPGDQLLLPAASLSWWDALQWENADQEMGLNMGVPGYPQILHVHGVFTWNKPSSYWGGFYMKQTIQLLGFVSFPIAPANICGSLPRTARTCQLVPFPHLDGKCTQGDRRFEGVYNEQWGITRLTLTISVQLGGFLCPF